MAAIDVDLDESEIPAALAELLEEAKAYLVASGASDKAGQRLIGKIELALEHWFVEEEGESVKDKGEKGKAAEESGESGDETEESGDALEGECEDCGAAAGEECAADCEGDSEDEDDADEEDEEDEEECEACGDPDCEDPDCEGDEDD